MKPRSIINELKKDNSQGTHRVVAIWGGGGVLRASGVCLILKPKHIIYFLGSLFIS
jgi:hypothetical protein